MKKLLLTGAGAALIGGLSTMAFCTTAQPAVAPQSARFTDAGQDMLGSNDAESAIRQFETALAVDPKNVDAYIGMARAYDQLGLPGRAVKFYREGLTIDPTNLLALEEQGAALIKRGAVARAEANLDRIREICGDCGEASRLQGAIAAGPPAVEDPASAEAAMQPDTDVEQPEPPATN